MPYVSKAQRAYFHANKGKLEKQGVNVAEWDKSTGNRALPQRITPSKDQKAKSKLRRGMQGKAR